MTLTVPADAAAAGEASRRFKAWLNTSVLIDSERSADIVLAVYEALANCADHAYRTGDPAGDMTLEATLDRDTATVRACVTDHGRWLDPDSEPADSPRGRGLLLMRALSDELTVHGTETGTVVCLHFQHCPGAR